MPSDPLSATSEISVSPEEEGDSTPPALRDFGVGAQILSDLGVREMELLTNRARAIKGLEGFGLSVVGRRPIDRIEE